MPWAEDRERRGNLLRAAFIALRDHLNRPHLRGIGDFSAVGIRGTAREDVQHLLILATECRGDHAAWCRNRSQVLAVWTEDLHTGVRRHVEAAVFVDRAAITAARTFELRKLPLVRQ